MEVVHDGVAVTEVRANMWFKGNDAMEDMTAAECRAAAHVLVSAAEALDRIKGGEQP